MRTITLCLLSGLAGALLMHTADRLSPVSSALAQSPARDAGSSASRAASDPPNDAPAAYDRDGLASQESIGVFVYEKNNRSVVNITTRLVRPDGFFLREAPDEGSGSGMVLDNDGHVLTNFHVLTGARDVKVTLFNNVTYDAELVGADSVNDIAVIRIHAPEDVLFPVVLGVSRRVRVGMTVFAIGNPLGYERTMTTGIVASLNRSLPVSDHRSIKSVIQIDATINPGNSGGPLLDSHGRLIGMNTAIATRRGQNSGMGFAIPVSLIRRVVPQLIRYGKVIRPRIGIQDVYKTEDGLLIEWLTPGGPAEQAGLRGPRITHFSRGPFVVERIDRTAADLIIAVNGVRTLTVDDFLTQVELNKPGDVVELTLIRDQQVERISVTLAGPSLPE